MADVFKHAYWRLAELMQGEGRLPDSDLLMFLTHYEIGRLLETRNASLVAQYDSSLNDTMSESTSNTEILFVCCDVEHCDDERFLTSRWMSNLNESTLEIHSQSEARTHQIMTSLFLAIPYPFRVKLHEAMNDKNSMLINLHACGMMFTVT